VSVRSAGYRPGLALLEVLVALVLVSLLVVGYLRLFQGGHHTFARSREWSEAVRHATDGMERAKLAPPGTRPDATEELPGGWRRQVVSGEWQPGVELVKVTVTMPDGGTFDIYRLRPEQSR
jgi:prepilin-type N-terminal cleavage/methylation domain-containing protein